MLLLGAVDGIASLHRPEFIFANPKYWIFPLQTLICGGLILTYWKNYQLSAPKKIGFTLAIAILVFGIWIAPQELLGSAPRNDGFDPTPLASNPYLYWGTLGFRFLRLVIVVPFIEEIFWRGFLLRYLIREDFEQLPFGSYTWTSFGIVTLMFGLAHWGPDFVPALICGALYNGIAIHTRSLSSCVLAHAVTNLLLGIYIMATRQWGFW